MLSAMRRVRLLSLAALIVIAGSVPTSLTAVMHDGGDDAHQPTLVQHNESAHRVGAPVPHDNDRAPHCPVCHWLHSLQSIVDAQGVAEPVAGFRPLVVVAPAFADRSLEGSLPARAPPAA
jgi:hypothetical protein